MYQEKHPLLTVTGLSIKFGKKEIVNQVAFTITPGHIVALIGANGSGKTTIMKALLGLIDIDHGSIQIDGVETTMNAHQSLHSVGALIEYPSIYPFLTGREQLSLFANGQNRQQHVHNVIETLEMTSYIDKKAKLYSLGMKQKLGIAQAMVNQPKLVILDEPMNGLDPHAIKLLRDYIRQQANAGTSFLISSHILSELEKIADEFLFLDKGNIISTGTLEEITSSQICSYRVKTSDDTRAYELLSKLQISITETIPLTFEVSSPEALTDALRVIVNADLKLVEITQNEPNLEQLFLKTIDTKELH